jgi:hypothetical protein
LNSFILKEVLDGRLIVFTGTSETHSGVHFRLV